jgi:hypothetical protein
LSRVHAPLPLQHVLRKGLHKVRYYGLWRWSRREHAAQARLGRAHAPISLDRAELYQQMLAKYERSIVFYRALA